VRYKDFPKHDFRRCLAVLLTIDDLGTRASVHYVAQALDCTRAEVARSITLAQQQFSVDIEKTGSVYKIAAWGFLNRAEVSAALRPQRQPEMRWPGLWEDRQENRPVWTREKESELVELLADAVALQRLPVSDREADVYRLSAQLLKTRYRNAADFLDMAARQFYADAAVAPRPFPKVVADGLVSDVPRLRNLLEKRMSGVRSW
jgi:hypothetical protein